MAQSSPVHSEFLRRTLSSNIAVLPQRSDYKSIYIGMYICRCVSNLSSVNSATSFSNVFFDPFPYTTSWCMHERQIASCLLDAFCRFSEFLRQRNCKRTDWYVARVLLEILAQFERQQHWWEVVALHLLLIEEADTLNILPVGKNRERPKKLQY